MGRLRKSGHGHLPNGMAMKGGTYYAVTSSIPRRWVRLGKDFLEAVGKLNELIATDDRFKRIALGRKSQVIGGSPREFDENSDIPVLLVSRVRSSSANRSLENTLTNQDIADLYRRSEGKCEITGIRFTFSPERNYWRSNPWAPSVDRIESTKSYTRDNCRIVCHIVNRAMGEWGEEVFSKMCMAFASTKVL